MSDSYYRPDISPDHEFTENDVFKVVLVGDSGVGKTSLIKRYTDSEYNPYNEPTIGGAHLTKIVQIPSANSLVNTMTKDKYLKLDIWDTAGSEKFRSLSKL